MAKKHCWKCYVVPGMTWWMNAITGNGVVEDDVQAKNMILLDVNSDGESVDNGFR